MDVEKAIISAIFIDNDSDWRPLLNNLSDNFFSDKRLKIVFLSMKRLASSNTVIDLVTVSNDLRSQGLLGSIGGASFLASVIDVDPFLSHHGYSSRMGLVDEISFLIVKLCMNYRNPLAAMDKLKSECNNMSSFPGWSVGRANEILPYLIRNKINVGSFPDYIRMCLLGKRRARDQKGIL